MSKTKETNTKRNDQHSDAKNPNNPNQKVAQDNRANQKKPNHKESKSNK
jgi:hypothetical protein